MLERNTLIQVTCLEASWTETRQDGIATVQPARLLVVVVKVMSRPLACAIFWAMFDNTQVFLILVD